METYKKSILEYDDVRDAVNYAREEGEEFGLKKGEEMKSIEIAKNALKEGFSSEIISKLTGLSIEEMEVLKS